MQKTTLSLNTQNDVREHVMHIHCICAPDDLRVFQRAFDLSVKALRLQV